MAVGSPAAEDDAEDAHRGGGRNHQQTDIDVRHLEAARQRQHGDCREPGDGGNHRSEPEDGAIRVSGNDVFLEHQFQGIGDGLKEAMRPYAHGAEARLEIGQHLALDQRQVAGDQRNQRDDGQRQHHRHE